MKFSTNGNPGSCQYFSVRINYRGVSYLVERDNKIKSRYQADKGR